MCKAVKFGLAVLLAGSSAFAAEAHRQEVEAFIVRARQLAGIRAEGALPFSLHVTFKLLGMPVGPVEGTYREDWASKERWRVEVNFPGFREIEAQTEQKRWRQGSVPARPLRVVQLVSLLRNLAPDALDPSHKVRSFRSKDLNGALARCAEIELRRDRFREYLREYCFEPGSGALLRRRDWYTSSWPGTLYWFSDLREFEDGLLPGTLRYFEREEEVVVAHLEGLERGAADEVALVAPPGAEEWPVCLGKLQPPKAKKTPDPRFSEKLRQARVEGQFMVQMTIETNGIPSRIEVLKTLSAADSEVIETLRKWRFRPASCDGKPIPFQVTLEVNFRRH